MAKVEALGVTLLLGAATLASAQTAPQWWTRELGAQSGPMVYDTARHCVVLFGGRETTGPGYQQFTPSRETWEWDGAVWHQRTPTRRPPADEALAYDATRRRVVLLVSGAVAMETWEYDGDDWTQRQPSTSPSLRSGHAMTWHAATQRVVLFGGLSPNVATPMLADTWTFDGTTWTRAAPPTAPPARWRADLVDDAARQVAVLHGGLDLRGSLQLDTWEWGGQQWKACPNGWLPLQGPTHLYYDSAQRGVIAASRTSASASQPLTLDHWRWDGTRWRRVRQTRPALDPEGMVYDLDRQQLVAVGGRSDLASQQVPVYATQTLDRAGWTMQATRNTVYGGKLAYDHAQGKVMALVGSDTYFWHANAWRRATATGPLPVRDFTALASDPTRGHVVLFGGVDAVGYLADTWQWDGAMWTQIATARGPSARCSHAMAFDTNRQVAVLFGGWSITGSVLGDTWEWNGSVWRERQPATAPQARAEHAMAYDAARGQTVLFSGIKSLRTVTRNELADTWLWDGQAWREGMPDPGPWPTQSPWPRTRHSLAYDDSRQRVVLFGDYDTYTDARWDTWEWDGSAWTQTANRWPERVGTSLAYDVANACMVMPGHSRTWLYGTPPRTATVAIGMACAGSQGLPILTSDVPRLGHAHLQLELLDACPRAPSILALATATQNMPLGGGCTLYLQGPVLPFLLPTDAAGRAVLTMAVPTDPSLRGLTLYAQAVIADPQGGGGGLAFTAGRRLVVDG